MLVNMLFALSLVPIAEDLPDPNLPYIVFLIPIAGMAMVLGIIGIIFWYKAREKELQYHQDLRIREMEHQHRMKELELELEKTRAGQAAQRV